MQVSPSTCISVVAVVLLNVLGCRLTYYGQAETNAEAWFSIALRPWKPEGSLGWTAQDSHLDSHTAPELWKPHMSVFRSVMYQHVFSCLASLARSVSRIEVQQAARDSMTPVWLQVWSSGLRWVTDHFYVALVSTLEQTHCDSCCVGFWLSGVWRNLCPFRCWVGLGWKIEEKGIWGGRG